jgi:hypothetical protein
MSDPKAALGFEAIKSNWWFVNIQHCNIKRTFKREAVVSHSSYMISK